MSLRAAWTIKSPSQKQTKRFLLLSVYERSVFHTPKVQLQQRTCDARPSSPWHCKHTSLARTSVLTATEHRNNKRVQEAKYSKRFTKQG